MPVYEYRCLNCGAELEIEHGIREPARKTHAHKNERPLTKTYPPRAQWCLGELERLISKSSFILRGGGWSGSGYST